MRQRSIPIRIWLDEKEEHLLKTNAKKTGLSISGYLRSLLIGHVPRAQPSEDFFLLYRELNAVGNNLNQIAARANAIGFINAHDFTNAAKEVQNMTLKIYQAVTRPERIE